MKIVGITSSLSRDGNSVSLLREALRGASSAKALTEEISLADCHLEYCRGCLSCITGTSCSLSDDLNRLRDTLIEADGIILSSPTHGLAPNAVMKNFMDRIGIYAVYRSALGGKYIAGIATAGGIGAKKTAKILTGLADGLFGRGYVTGYLGIHLSWGDVEKYYPQARQLGINMVSAIQQKRRYHFQNLFNRLLSALIIKPIMKKNIRRNKDKMLGVYNYLTERGRI